VLAASGDLDDPTITDDTDLWRRIPPQWFVLDENRGGIRPASAAFDDDPDGGHMSVFLATVMLELGRGPQDALAGHPGFALAAITAAVARAAGQAIVRRPTPEEPAHAEVVGRKTGSVKKALYRAARWVVPPASWSPAPKGMASPIKPADGPALAPLANGWQS
jgi:hypothetical protein